MKFTSRTPSQSPAAAEDPRKSLEFTAHTSPADIDVDEELAEGAGTNSSKKELENETPDNKMEVEEEILKVPDLTPIYWCEKMTATTFGETFADFFTQTLAFGYATTSIVLISLFIVCLLFQLRVKSYWPLLFWAVMATSSIAGTAISDFIDRTLGWGYPVGMGVLLGILLFILALWKLSGEHMNVAGAMNRKAEAFYWSTILVSNTLGTALGDFFADSLNLGFAVSAGIFGSLLAILAFLAYFSKVSHVVLFWVAFVLTRPFGATFGDFLTKSQKKGGLDLGTLKASMVILALFVISFAFEMYYLQKAKKLKAKENEVAKMEK
jgi:uncharacterized membrane-anchored protein